MNRFVSFVWFFLCLVLQSEGRKREKFVTTSIDATWEQTPLVLEIAEYIAEENAKHFWSFIDNINALDKPLETYESERDRYETALAVAASYMSVMQMRLLRFALSLRAYSPRIEMYEQIARQQDIHCLLAVELAGKIVCTETELRTAVDRLIVCEGGICEKIERDKPEIFKTDHQYPNSENRTLTAILYGEIGTSGFSNFHDILKEYAIQGYLTYILRHHIAERDIRKVRLSGYGVELQMKSTEYKAEDDSVVGKKKEDTDSKEEDDIEVEGFNFNVLKKLHPELEPDLDKFRKYLEEESDELKPLKVWQFQELSLQAAEKIMSASSGEESLNRLIQISQNFPMQTRSLVNELVLPERRKEIETNQEKFMMMFNIQPTDTALFINGLFYDMDLTDIFTVLETCKVETRIMESLYTIGINDRSAVSSMLSLDLAKSSSGDYAIDIRDSAIIWINDLEHDSRYRRWPSYLTDLLKPTFPGMLRNIRRNLFNVVLICNPASRTSWPLLKLAESFIVHSAPIRVGVVFVNPPAPATGLTDVSVAMLNAFNYVAEEKTNLAGLSFITEVYATIKADRDVEVDDVKKRLKAFSYSVDINDVLGEDSDYNTGRQLAADFVNRAGLRTFPQVLVNGAPLAQQLLTKDDFEEAMLTEFMPQVTMFQKAVYRGELTDSDDVLEFIMNRPNVMPRLNSRILNTEDKRYLDFTTNDRVISMVQNIDYLSTKNPNKTSLLTMWIVADFDTARGRKLLENALEYMEDTTNDYRLAVIVNPTGPSIGSFNTKIIEAIKNKSNRKQLLTVLKTPDTATSENSENNEAKNSNQEFVNTKEAQDREFCKFELSFKPGDNGVIVNGRVIGPLDADEEFIKADFMLMERHSLKSFVDSIYKALKPKLNKIEGSKSDVLMKAVSLLANRQQTKTRFSMSDLLEKHSVIIIPPKLEDQPVLELTVIVDPVSRGAQKVGSIISVLRHVLNAEIKIFLNSVEKNSDMPLKSYYRYVLASELRFNEDGRLENGPIANFTGVATTSLLTQNMHVPENWLVESVATPYDLDNIRLADVDSVYSQFELEHLLLEGHCFDGTYGSPPRGLQITLGTTKTPVIVDTIVMANLGYFQLKASPGAWVLRLRQGRSADLYDIVSHEGTDTAFNSTDVKVLVSSFQSHTMKLKVNKKPGKIHEDLLGEEDTGGGIWSSIANTFTGSTDESTEEEPINIFSLASGHLYERFLRIMMLSVIKHTKSPVKFWFLKNYLSPSFKDFLPRMAAEYKFKYELVQYKWPRWLHQQTEKQRLIWGYKILFLDVLFPLHVKKIIFVDADQVVRADMKELVDLDLHGAPYGYTPFCDSRTEMDGFRFWKHGYWKSHLQNRRYHISALYVVDLKRFRKIAAGDRLRGQYQALSQDPNSLSNLDQDLPNNMIHQVPIKSLPQEWLWCETWCDDASKASAKTIDLCNNPMTKEAKLTAAMRIISEWSDYDNEIKRLQLRLDETAEEEIFKSDEEGSKEPEQIDRTEL